MKQTAAVTHAANRAPEELNEAFQGWRAVRRILKTKHISISTDVARLQHDRQQGFIKKGNAVEMLLNDLVRRDGRRDIGRRRKRGTNVRTHAYKDSREGFHSMRIMMTVI